MSALLTRAVVNDDPYITYRYARNLASGALLLWYGTGAARNAAFLLVTSPLMWLATGMESSLYLALTAVNPLYVYDLLGDAWFRAAYTPAAQLEDARFWGSPITIREPSQ